jgi:hypothetical protein
MGAPSFAGIGIPKTVILVEKLHLAAVGVRLDAELDVFVLPVDREGSFGEDHSGLGVAERRNRTGQFYRVEVETVHDAGVAQHQRKRLGRGELLRLFGEEEGADLHARRIGFRADAVVLSVLVQDVLEAEG